MKKQQKGKKQKRQKAVSQPQKPEGQVDRRRVLTLARNGAIGALVLAGVGYFSVTSVQATMAEHNLARIGQGLPAIVQIHDPNCALCRSLQKETRAALRAMDTDDLIYLVANINTHEGSTLAARHGVQHVTLLLMDAEGTAQDVVHGVQDRDVLQARFEAHLNRN